MICIAECEIPIGDIAFLGIVKSVVGLHNSTGSYRQQVILDYDKVYKMINIVQNRPLSV